jgi:hypothetical protein
MNIKDKFLELTSRTYPHGTEQDIYDILIDGLEKDEFGNLFIKIGDTGVMFTSHLDTATSALTSVKHVIEGNIIKTDGKTILGADDKAGVTIMLYMIENKIPGLYYFFLGEEVGCIGSRKVAEKQKLEKIDGIEKVISFDRRGTNSVITYQSGKRCASDKFGEALAAELNKADITFSYVTDPTGVLTDSIQFTSIYPECTNISVGYKSEHTFSETQDIEHLQKLANACLKVDWENLPVERDPSKVEYKSYSTYGWGDWEDDYDYGYKPSSFNRFNNWGNSNNSRSEKVWFHDKEFNYVSNVEVRAYDKKYLSVDLHNDRIQKEKLIIENLLIFLEVDFKLTTWDGMNLLIDYNQKGHVSSANRNDLIEYLPELDYRKIEEMNCDLTEDFTADFLV